MRKHLLSVFVVLVLASVLSAKSLLNLDDKGVAIQGYDPVAYFTDNKPVKGDSSITATHAGATYHFATAEHREAFVKEPDKYAPLYGGYCAYGVSKNATVQIDPSAFVIQEGHLLLQKSKKVLGWWNDDPSGNFVKAQSNWPKLVEKNGK